MQACLTVLQLEIHLAGSPAASANLTSVVCGSSVSLVLTGPAPCAPHPGQVGSRALLRPQPSSQRGKTHPQALGPLGSACWCSSLMGQLGAKAQNTEKKRKEGKWGFPPLSGH